MKKKPASPQLAVYLGNLRKDPIYALEFAQNPDNPESVLRWGEPTELVVDKGAEGPGRIVEMLKAFERREIPDDYEAPGLSDENEALLGNRRRIAVVLEPFGRILLYPSRHYEGGTGYGTPREGTRGNVRMSDFELLKLARSL